MKSATKATTVYESPECWVIGINVQALVCTSPSGQGNEEYEEGSTSGWYNN